MTAAQVIMLEPGDVPHVRTVSRVEPGRRHGITWLGEVYPNHPGEPHDLTKWVAAIIVTDAEGEREQIEHGCYANFADAVFAVTMLSEGA